MVIFLYVCMPVHICRTSVCVCLYRVSCIKICVRLSVSCISCVYGVCACSMVQVGDQSLAEQLLIEYVDYVDYM